MKFQLFTIFYLFLSYYCSISLAQTTDNFSNQNASQKLYHTFKQIDTMSISNQEKASLFRNKIKRMSEATFNARSTQDISKITELYNVEKLKVENLENSLDNIDYKYTAIIIGIVIVFVGVIIFLAYTIRKNEQEIEVLQKEIREQQLTSQLKEQELKTINGLVEKQEKERLTIANELHDELGSLMANIKLHFSTFKDTKESEDLFIKTNELIDEAYHKIKHIAHAKKSGLLSKHGLYKAVLDLSESVGETNKIKINVLQNQFNKRIENSLDISLFRTIQELINNVIKHAKASEIDVYLNQHDDGINIMVEDNGKGFNTTQLTKKSTGIGLLSAERRIENLGGKMMIESQPGKGTSVIIDMPA